MSDLPALLRAVIDHPDSVEAREAYIAALEESKRLALQEKARRPINFSLSIPGSRGRHVVLFEEFTARSAFDLFDNVMNAISMAKADPDTYGGRNVVVWLGDRGFSLGRFRQDDDTEEIEERCVGMFREAEFWIRSR